MAGVSNFISEAGGAPARSRRRTLAVGLACAIVAATACLALAPSAQAKPAGQPVISQIYGGGGNLGAQYQTDFIEIFNRRGSPIDLTGWSVQYAASGSGSWSLTPLTGTLGVGQYRLIAQGSAGGGVGAPLPTPDNLGTIDLSNTSGKVALVNSFTPLSGTCPTGLQILDFVGYGGAASCFEGAPTVNASNTTAIIRKTNGCTETNNNANDFAAGIPGPRNSATTPNPCFPIPATPTVTATAPPSPSNDLTPEVRGTAPAGTTVEIYTNAACSGTPAATGTAAAFAGAGITTTVTANSTTTFYALAFDVNNSSACSASSVTYVNDTVAPPTPTLISSSPASPANDASPEIRGSAAAGTTVRIYPNATCTGAPVGTDTDSVFASPGITVTVAPNSTTTLRATATDAAGNTSPCSTSSLTYVQDSTLPAAPTFTASVPASPANDTTPNIRGSAEAGSTVRLYTDAACTVLAATGTAAQFSSSGIAVTVPANSTTTFWATATSSVGNASACSTGSLTYVEDSAPPAEPTFTGSTPASPANDTTPLIAGSSDPGSTVRLYTDAACTNLAGTGTAAEFAAPGIGVTVPSNSTTTFHATATDSVGNTSACSADTITYVEDSAPPAQPTFTASDPPSPSTDATPLLIGTAAPGSSVDIYTDAACTNLAASGTAAEFAAPGIGVIVTPGTTTTFHATATDAVGNTSPCSSSSLTYVQDSGAPPPPVLNATAPASPASSTTPRILGSAEPGSTVRIYTDAACTALAATGTAAEFASPGIEVTVAPGSTTTFRATATDALDNTSACSPGSIAYTQADPAPPPPPPATPVLTGLRMTPDKFSITQAKTSVGSLARTAARRGTQIRFKLSAPARVAFTVRRRPPVGQPPAPTAGLIKTFGRLLPAGKQSVPFSGRLGQRLFRPGKYRMFVLVQRQDGGGLSRASVPFTIVPG